MKINLAWTNECVHVHVCMTHKNNSCSYYINLKVVPFNCQFTFLLLPNAVVMCSTHLCTLYFGGPRWDLAQRLAMLKFFCGIS